MKKALTPYILVKLLRQRKSLEEELAAMGQDPKIVKEVSRPSASNRGGSWKQQVKATYSAIEQIDKMLLTDRIQLPKPHKWWEPEKSECTD
jgi:hypothetical protein